jgi:guanylate kinase
VKRQQGSLFVVSGPSGVGKTTVVASFLNIYSKQYKVSRVVTYTTKTPRSTEVNGIDYHFITESEFEEKVKENFFLEWSGEYGAYYGTPAHIIKDLFSGQSYILVIDRIGAAQIIEKYPHTILIWIHASSINVLSDRLKGRKTDSFDQIQTRLFIAKKEIEQESHLPMYHHHIVNDELDSCVERLFALIAPRCFSVLKDII